MKKIIFIIVFSTLSVISVKSFSQVVNSLPRDGFYDKKVIEERKPIPYPWVREADVFFARRLWRVIDLREKMNQPFYYPEQPHNNLRSLMQVLMDALKEGTITAYDATSGTDEFAIPLTYQEIMNKMEFSKTVTLQRATPPYDWYDTIINSTFNTTDVKRYRIKEDWFFDKQRSVLECRILGLCPVRDAYDENGVFRAYEPLFWIDFYEARKILAKAEVFNRKNDAAKNTYDEVFWKRMFASYIYKESNVYDRRINDYATGVDAIYESERIKDEIFNFEQNLWEY